MVFNATFNNIYFSYVVAVSFLFWWGKPECPGKTTDLSRVTDKLYHIILYRKQIYINAGTTVLFHVNYFVYFIIYNMIYSAHQRLHSVLDQLMTLNLLYLFKKYNWD